MSKRTLREAATDYWQAVGQTNPLPNLPEDPLDVLIELIDITDAADQAFTLVSQKSDPYPGIAVGDDSQLWSTHWAVQLSELEAFSSPSLEDTVFFIDTVMDNTGHYRVYSQRDGLRGDLAFADLTAALTWMASHVQHARGELDAAGLAAVTKQMVSEHADAWEQNHSGFTVLEELDTLPLEEAWDAYRDGHWPMLEPPLERAPRDREPGWGRRLSLWVTAQFLGTRHVVVPKDVDTMDLAAPHRALISHLRDFEEAIAMSTMPDVITKTTRSDDDILAELATQWHAAHEAWQRAMRDEDAPNGQQEDTQDTQDTNVVAPKKPESESKAKAKSKAKTYVSRGEAMANLDMPEEPEEEDTPFIRKLRAALHTTLTTMLKEEVIEVEEDHMTPLIHELVRAAANTHSVKHMLSALTKALVNSAHVEEIYCTDSAIRDHFQGELGD